MLKNKMETLRCFVVFFSFLSLTRISECQRQSSRVSSTTIQPTRSVAGRTSAPLKMPDNQVCGAHLIITSNGKITSPGYPKNYPNQLECTWYLTTSQDRTISLRIVDSSIEETTNCESDYLAIYSGRITSSGNLLHRLCGTKSDLIIDVKSSQATLVFMSDFTSEARGFQIIYSLNTAAKTSENLPVIAKSSPNQGCGGKITVTRNGGKLQSPSYPKPYPSKSECHWELSIPEGILVLNIVDLILESDPKCSSDSLSIYQSTTTTDPPAYILCEQTTNLNLKINSKHVLLVFVSDATFEERGFQIQYQASLPGPQRTLSATPKPIASPPSSGGCLKTFTMNEGIIKSPNYPMGYPANSDCWYNIRVPEREKVFLRFDDFELGHDCLLDYVVVYDGNKTESPKLARYCKLSLPNNLRSTKNNLLVHFHSGDRVNTIGRFSASYSIFGFAEKDSHEAEKDLHEAEKDSHEAEKDLHEAEKDSHEAEKDSHEAEKDSREASCSWISGNSENGTITSPNYPHEIPPGVSCEIDIVAPDGYRVEIIFEPIPGQTKDNCTFEHITIKDNSTKRSLEEFCDDFRTISLVLSIKKTAKVLFKGASFNSSNRLGGFKASVKFVMDHIHNG